MALLWVDGFDKIGPSDGSALVEECGLPGKYEVNKGFVSQGYSVAGRYGGGAYKIFGTSSRIVTPDLNPQSQTLIVGFNFQINTYYNNNQWLLDLRHPGADGETVGYKQFNVSFYDTANTLELQVFRGNTSIATTNTLNLQVDTWYSLELKVYCHSTSGTMNLYVDGTEVASFSGNTRHRTYDASGWDRYSRLMLRPGVPGVQTYDDLWVADTTGNTNNDVLLSDFRVESLSPASDVSGNWATTETDLYEAIDEDTKNTSQYISTSGSGNQALFELDNLSANAATGTIHGAMLNAEAISTNRFAKAAKYITQNGVVSAIEDGVDVVSGIGTNDLNRTAIMENDPDGNAWSAATINSLRLGVELK